MSEEKKRDRALQHRVRERQAKTGESYQAAWRQVIDSDAKDVSATLKQNADELSHINSEMTEATLRVLAKQNEKLADELATLRARPSSVCRSILPLSTSVKILPGESAQIAARPQTASFWPDRLLIKNADRWDVDHLTAGWHTERPASLLETGQHASKFSQDVWHPLTKHEVLAGEEVVCTVNYNGPNKDGEYFEAALFGWEGHPPPPQQTAERDTDNTDRVTERAESKDIAPASPIKLPIHITSPALFVDRLTINDAKHWLVHDIRVRGISILVQAGDLPGEMFSGRTPVILEPLAAEDCVEVMATYVGLDTAARLVIELSGSTKPPSVERAVSYSYFLPMSTGVMILPTQSAQITGRPQRNFLAERMFIANADEWIVNDIRIVNRHQFVQSGDVPGQCFSTRIVGGSVTFDPTRAGLDFVLVTTRGEDCEIGAPFFCGVEGRLLRRV